MWFLNVTEHTHVQSDSQWLELMSGVFSEDFRRLWRLTWERIPVQLSTWSSTWLRYLHDFSSKVLTFILSNSKLEYYIYYTANFSSFPIIYPVSFMKGSRYCFKTHVFTCFCMSYSFCSISVKTDLLCERQNLGSYFDLS